jgi:Circularly permuted ATP-grasp type 2
MAARSDTVVDTTSDGSPSDGLARLLAGYRPLAGIFDEMMHSGGQVRPHWAPFLTMLASLGTEEINRRFAVADRYLQDSGVFYRVYGDPAGAERPWPLSHMPLIINPSEWAGLKSGLIQRARLLELVLADAYGAATIVRDGLVPAVLIAGNPEFLRPLAGVGGDRGPRAPASYWRAGSPCSAPYPRSTAPSRSSGWRRSSRPSSPRCRASTARTIHAFVCSPPGR